jgi:diaminopropionate ammonia-lyase
MHEVAKETHDLSIPQISTVIIQAGVGSWPSAVVHFLRKYKRNNHIKIICVEPFESDAIYESIKRSELATTTKTQKTVMAGLNCGTPSKVALEILKNGTDAFLLISDAYAIDAIKYLNAPLPGDAYIAAGESGAAGLGGLIAMMRDPHLRKLKDFIGLSSESNVLLFNTETVTNPVLLDKIMNNKEAI